MPSTGQGVSRPRPTRNALVLSASTGSTRARRVPLRPDRSWRHTQRDLPSDNIRVIGIDTPEVGTPCEAPATEHLRALIAGRALTLLAAPGREDHDGYGRRLSYVEVAGVDVGRQMIADGYALARYDSLDGYQTHPRQADYRALDAATPAAC